MIALIAGQGALPAHLSVAMQAQGQAHVIYALQGQAPDLDGIKTFRLEQLGTLLAELGAQGVTQVCFAGAVTRPQIDMSAIDGATLPLVPKIAAAMAGGDDGTLRVAIGLFEDAGFDVIGAPAILPDLLPSAGVLGAVRPSERDLKDITRAQDVHAALAAADVGQACIVAHGQVLAVEAIKGTDWMMQSLMVQPAPTNAASTGDLFSDPLGFAADVMGGPVVAPVAAAQRDPSLPTGGVLFKAPKPAQDMRIDLPTIGPATIDRAAHLGLNGIALGANTQVIELDRVIAAADETGLFVTVIP
ncbi:LpxI family protein [Nereida sp. MMG025]|uniref:LpxI family protein n=1 Tax=Nereida sp. MMG025 TaxID=2909981 RepID=UPI001F309BC2|nr:UDP-2,3-diacylglucosamine diphosphatase LpxI [Nereida sp. MMG025]MCF6443225.1 UDP-2,3-diacylglucosamine diphosphatase LpxI [Nereida sp. MMG025]